MLGGCGGSSGETHATTSPAVSPPTRQGSTVVTIEHFAFSPANLTVAPGATITVVNKDDAVHTLTATDHAFDTGRIAAGATATITAPSGPGAHPYLCSIHQFMTGTMTVR